MSFSTLWIDVTDQLHAGVFSDVLAVFVHRLKLRSINMEEGKGGLDGANAFYTSRNMTHGSLPTGTA